MPSTRLWEDMPGKKQMRRSQVLFSTKTRRKSLPSWLHSNMRVQSIYRRFHDSQAVADSQAAAVPAVPERARANGGKADAIAK